MPSVYPVRSGDITAPANEAYAVTPDNTTNFTTPFRGLYVGNTGNVSVATLSSNTSVLFVAVPAGATLSIRGVRVNATGTTATNIVALV